VSEDQGNRRSKRRRRFLLAALVVVVGGGALTYRHLTDSERVRVIVEKQLQRYAPGLVSVGGAEFSLFDGTVIRDVVVRARERSDLPPVLECPRIEVMHGAFGALFGRPKIEALLAIEPKCTIVQDQAASKTSLAGVIEEVARTQPSQAIALPLVELRNARVRVISRRNGQDRLVEDLRLTVRGRTSPKDNSLYDIVWQSASAVQGAANDGHSQLDLNTGALRNVEGGLPRMSVEAVMVAVNAGVEGAGAWAELLGLGGTLHARDYSLGEDATKGRSATIDLTDAAISVPVNDEEAELPLDQRYLRFSNVNGTIVVSAKEVAATFQGIFHDRPCTVEGTIDISHQPKSLSDLGFDVQLSVDGLNIPRPDLPDRPEEARLIATWPGLAHLHELFDPTGPADLSIEVVRDAGADRPTRIRRVEVRPKGMTAVAAAFPYRLEQITGSIEVTESGGIVRDLHARHQDADIRIDGTFDAPGPCATAHVTVHGADVRLDRTLREALLPFQRQTWDTFTPKGSVNLEVEVERKGCDVPHAGEWLVTTTVDFKDLAARFDRFPYPLEHVQGSLVLTEDRVIVPEVTMTRGDTKVRASGEVGTTAEGLGEVRLDIQGTSIPIDETLLRSLPADARSMLAPFHATGHVDFRTQLTKEPEHPRLSHTTVVTLKDNAIRHEEFPVPITGLLGQLRIDERSTRLVDVTGRYGAARLQATGQVDAVDAVDGGHALDLTFVGNGVTPDAALIRALPADWRKHLEPWRIDGEIDITVHAHATPSAPHDRRIDGEIDLGGISVTPPGFGAPVTDVTGRLEINHTGLRSPDGLSGRFGPARLTGTVDCLFQDGVPRSATARLSARDLALNDSIRTLLSKQYQDLWRRLQPSGSVDLSIDSLTYTQPAGDASPILRIEGGRAKLHDVALEGMVGIDRAIGDVTFDGHLRDRLGGVVLQGDVDLAGLRVYERKLTQSSSQWTLMRTAKGNGRLELRDIEGHMYDGIARGSLVVMMTPQKNNYELSARLRDVDLAPLLKPAPRSTDRESQLQGRTDVEVELAGTVGNADSKRGRGTLAINEGKIYQLPIVFAMLQVLNLSVPDRDTFDLLRASGLIDGDQITVTEARIAGEAMALVGNGTITLPALATNLNFISVNPKRDRQVPVLSEVIQHVGGEFVTLGVSGTLREPVVELRLLRGITDELDRIFVPQNPKKR